MSAFARIGEFFFIARLQLRGPLLRTIFGFCGRKIVEFQKLVHALFYRQAHALRSFELLLFPPAKSLEALAFAACLTSELFRHEINEFGLNWWDIRRAPLDFVGYGGMNSANERDAFARLVT